MHPKSAAMAFLPDPSEIGFTEHLGVCRLSDLACCQMYQTSLSVEARTSDACRESHFHRCNPMPSDGGRTLSLPVLSAALWVTF